MHRIYRSTLVFTAALVLAGVESARAQDVVSNVADEGAAVSGWMATTGGGALEAGTLADVQFTVEGDAWHVITGPAVTYWKSDGNVSGSYAVTATFTEPEFMNLMNHPHPYGIVIAGNNMGTEQKSYLYCATYGDGRFIVRGFGPEPFRLNGRRPDAHPAVNQAAGKGEPVSQEIALSVTSDVVECSINGTVVASYDRADVVTDGRLDSTDGVYGLRFAHNTEVIVSDLEVVQR